ncbi:MAG: MltA domain-containing protein [Burkholderiales bacterium]
MVHQTISTSSTIAPAASSKITHMNRLFPLLATLLIVGTLLASCGSAPPTAPEAAPRAEPPRPRSTTLPPQLQGRGGSRWTAVDWTELPGWGEDQLFEAWNAWIKSCERPGPNFAPLCTEVRSLSIGTPDEQRDWMMARLQPYRVEPVSGASDGLLTSYYEPVLEGSRTPLAGFAVPLYRPPADLVPRRPWFTRQQMETLPQARAALAGREIAWLSDPIDALVLQIQGSGRVRITEADGSQKLVRLAYAATNDQPYMSVGRWLLDQGAIRDGTWPGIKAWVVRNPERVQEMLWANPRVVFFREEPLGPQEAVFGPKGAQGVALTPGRSIAVDPTSIPYGTPVWLASSGQTANLQKLVLAQDTGSAITGAVRADYFAGWGTQAAELAGRLKQPLKLWVLWPRAADAPLPARAF